MPSVLFVCTANMCRSPLAEVLFEALLRAGGASVGWTVASAGVAASHGMPATDFSVQVAAERGLDLTGHRSRPVTADLLQANDLVLVMEQAHRQELRMRFPQLAERVQLLTEMAGERGDVLDPVDTTLEQYRLTADWLTDLLARGQQRIRALAAGQARPDRA